MTMENLAPETTNLTNSQYEQIEEVAEKIKMNLGNCEFQLEVLQ